MKAFLLCQFPLMDRSAAYQMKADQRNKRNFYKGGKTGAKSLEKSSNPFDKFANSRKKHEVLNRRVKGEDRDVGRAKKKAVDDRKTRLLDQYKKNNRTNLFVDKRFGEQDADLSLEDKMYLRLQKEKIRSSRNLSMYNLDANEETTLTHKGQVLGNSNINEATYSDDDDDGLDREVVSNLHFGGGLVEKKDNDNKSSHYDALQEIIAKSKVQKQMKKEAKEEQEIETDRLDQAFRELVKEADVKFRANRHEKPDADELEDEEADEYDQSIKLMQFESKVKASDRTKTPEEIALEAKKKLEELEKARIQRMKEDAGEGAKKKRTDDDIDFDIPVKNRGGVAAASTLGEEEEEDFDNEEEDDDEEDSEDGSDGSDSEEEEGVDYEIDDYDGENGEGEDNNDDEEGDESEEEEGSEEEEDDGEEDDDSEDDDDLEQEVAPPKKDKSEGVKSKYAERTKELQAKVPANPIDRMPHQIDCPSDIHQFDELIKEYTSSLEDIAVLIDRILVWNSVLLPGAEGANNRVPMHNFMDILMKYFIRVGDTLALHTNSDTLHHIDFLTGKMFKLSQEISDVIPQLWGRWIKLSESQLQKRLRDYSMGETTQTWPSVGKLLLFQLLGLTFSITDFHHAIFDSATLLLCQLLVQCPVCNIQDLSSGLLVASILCEYMQVTGKYIPEVISFITSCYGLYASIDRIIANDIIIKTFDSKEFSWLKGCLSTKATTEDVNVDGCRIKWEYFSMTEPSSDEQQLEVSINVLSTLYKMTNDLISQYESNASFPEIFSFTLLQLNSMELQSKPTNKKSAKITTGLNLPPSLLQQHKSLRMKLIELSEKHQSERVPLQWRQKQLHVTDAKNPKFEANYKMKKDLDGDQEKIVLKQLKRQLTREKKAATRELRRDNEFLDQVRFQEKQEQRQSQQEERWKNFHWMEDQQAQLNTYVKKHKVDLRGGGSKVVKPIKSRRTKR